MMIPIKGGASLNFISCLYIRGIVQALSSNEAGSLAQLQNAAAKITRVDVNNCTV